MTASRICSRRSSPTRKKAVVALKWAVREMEERYKKMSKLGVRNIDGYNARVAEAKAKGETLTRTVHTGYDKETGEAIYEKEELELEPLPYIVVIVDEMADLMMVAGKDIEGAVQRLAQMARAAGIHVILATQRPSVDVITGTIKANFPTRISFQVTSKIDSRTILGEQGAEQLLGQGDMLYMAGGGRISRVHGPFVSDDEVEKVVRHLKSQGAPQYLEAVTAEDEEEDEDGIRCSTRPRMGATGDATDLYQQAVQIVMRDKKASTSYIQRRLQIGYNRAASHHGADGEGRHRRPGQPRRQARNPGWRGRAREVLRMQAPRQSPAWRIDEPRNRHSRRLVDDRGIKGQAEHDMERAARRSRTAVLAALLSGLALARRIRAAAPAQSVPLPVPAPQPKTYDRPAAQAPRRRSRSRPAPQQPQQPRRPQQQQSGGFPSIFPKPPNLFGSSGETTAFDATAARPRRPRQRLSVQRAPAARRLRPGRPRRRQVGGRVLPAEARHGPLRLQPAEPDRADRRRPVGGGARPQARDPGPLSAVADAAALPAGRPHRSDARHQPGRRLCRRRVRHRGDRGAPDHSPARTG